MAKKINVEVEVDSKEAIKGVDKLTDSVDSLGNSVKETKEGTESLGRLKKPLKVLEGGFKAVGTALKGMGIGLIISGFLLLKEVLEKQQPVLDFLDKVLTSIGLAITAVSDALGNVYDSVNKSTDGFDALKTVLSNLLTIGIAPLKLAFLQIKGAIAGVQLLWEGSFFGGGDTQRIAELKKEVSSIGDEIIGVGNSVIDAGKSIVNNIGEAVSEVVTLVEASVDAVTEIDGAAIMAAANRTVELKKQAQIQEAINKGRLEQFDRLAEQQRQIRDDESKSIAERKEANNELGRVLEQQQRIMLANADVVVRAAQLEFNANKTTENRVALINAQNEKLAILAQIEGFRSEQKVNAIALNKEENELLQTSINGETERAKIRRDATAEQIKDEQEKLDKQIENNEISRAADEQRLMEVIANLEAGTQARIDAQEELLNARLEYDLKEEELNAKKLEVTQANADKQREIEKAVADAQIAARDSVIDSVAGGVKLLADIDKDNKKLQAGALITENAVGIAKTVINTQFANAAALATPQAIATSGAAAVPVIAANNIAAGLSIATSIAATAKGLAALKQGGGAGSKPSLGGGGGRASAPSINQDSLFSTQNLEGAKKEEIGTGVGLNQTPLKAVVLESEITNTQNTLSNLKDRAEIG